MSVGSVISNAAQKITGAISQAARSTGISFEYLVTTAQIESRLDPKAKAPTSTASGLYQFIDQTWLATLKKAGPALGLGQYADAIGKTEHGRYAVTDPDMRPEIMRLRHDPRASALMAGAFTRANETRLESRIGRQPTEGELYIAHFLGSGGAGKLISAAANQPHADAVDMFPRAARANRSVFYDRQGESRSVAGVYQELNRRYQMARNTAVSMGLLRDSQDPLTGTTSQLASASISGSAAMTPRVSEPTAATQALAAVQGATQPVSDPAGTTQVLAAARNVAWVNPDHVGTTQTFAAAAPERSPAPPPQPMGNDLPLFRAMFSDRGGAPVTPAVQHLWSDTKVADARQPAAQVPAERTAAPGQINPLDLFLDHPRDPRALFGTRKA
jgi:muramidase (phage lysozyme)